MKIIALGTGAAFTTKNWQTNFIIQENGKNLLVDCGGDIRHSILQQNMSYLDIDAVYISHLHGDHAGGGDYIAFGTYFDPRYKGKPKLFCERQLMRDLWDHSWRGSLEGLQGIDATIDTYFDTYPVDKNGYFTFEDVKFDIVQSIHISAKYAVVNSYGLMFNDNGKRIYIPTDSQFAPKSSMMAYYKESDIIFHDCETAPYESGVHAHYNDLVSLSNEIKQKMYLVHFQDNVIDEWDMWSEKAEKDGFMGFCKPGVIYETKTC